MKTKMMLFAMLLLIGCKGPDGKKGDAGATGLPGHGGGQFVFLAGNVTSNDIIVNDPRITQADQIGVYIGDGTNNLQLPYYLPAIGVNTFYVFRTNQVEIVNAQTAGATRYTIEIIVP